MTMPIRRLPDWLTGFDLYTQNSESPRLFHLWAAVSAIASALCRRCYIQWGHTTIYPNHYIVLVGPSGQSRKSEPINIARSLVEKVPGLVMIGEDNSLEAIIRSMADAYTTFTDPTNHRICFHSSVCCYTEELAVLTRGQNTEGLSFFTNWYDSRDLWTRTTKHQGVDRIQGMCFNLCSATAPDWIPYIFTKEAIGGGFSSRCIFVVEEGKHKIVADPNLAGVDKRLFNDLAHDLEIIGTMAGLFKLEPDAHKAHVEWYQSYETIWKDTGVAPLRAMEFRGYCSRRGSHLFKLAMIFSASRSTERIIQLGDWRRARALLEQTERKMGQVFAGMGSARYATETEQVLSFIATKGQATKADVLRAFYRNIDDYSLDIIIKVLSGMKVVRVVIGQGDTRYEYIQGNSLPH